MFHQYKYMPLDVVLALMGRMNSPSKRKPGPHRPAGSKMRKKARKGTLTMMSGLGIAGEAVRNLEKQRNLARMQERRAAA